MMDKLDFLFLNSPNCMFIIIPIMDIVITHITILFDIVQGFTTLNTVFRFLFKLYHTLGLERNEGREGGRNIYFSECNSSLLTLIPLHGLNTSSTAASHSLLIGHLMAEQAILASFV